MVKHLPSQTDGILEGSFDGTDVGVPLGDGKPLWYTVGVLVGPLDSEVVGSREFAEAGVEVGALDRDAAGVTLGAAEGMVDGACGRRNRTRTIAWLAN